MKKLLLIPLLFLIVSCGTTAFDNSEYLLLSKIQVDTKELQSTSCYGETSHVLLNAKYLTTFSKYSVASDIHKGYVGLQDLIQEMHDRLKGKYSKYYCNSKTEVIIDITEKMLKVYGKRERK